jgi:hypothetical protein
MDKNAPYEVIEQDHQFAVLSPSGLTIVQCRDSMNAQHYATLLNQAYRSGYKEGFRQGKQSK